MKAALRTLLNWLDDRFGAGTIEAALRSKTVPLHRHTVWYYFGGMTLFLFVVQLLTGILLLLYYRPTPNDAYESVEYIVTQVRFGWMIRSIHSWASNLMIFTAFVHMFSVYFMKAYRKPRELTWVTGILLLFLVMGFGFSGYLLPWNEVSFFATQVGTEIAGSVPLGTYRPKNTISSNPGIVSASGGTPGRTGDSFNDVTASGRTLPPLIWPSTAETSTAITGTRPATTSVSACGGLL